MELNTIKPGELADKYQWQLTDYNALQAAENIVQAADDMGFFEHADAMLSDELPNTEHLDLRAVEKYKPKLKTVHLAGIVGTTPQHIQIPDDCDVILVQATSMLWLGASSAITPNALQTIEQSASNFSVGCIAPGFVRTIVKPAGLSDLWIVSANAGNTVGISLYSNVSFADHVVCL